MGITAPAQAHHAQDVTFGAGGAIDSHFYRRLDQEGPMNVFHQAKW